MVDPHTGAACDFLLFDTHASVKPENWFQNRRGLAPFCVVFGATWGLSPSALGFETASSEHLACVVM
jgi:hypothetical protein